MSDRHEKWVRVEPGTVIPAGQPYRQEFGYIKGVQAKEWVSSSDVNTANAEEDADWFVDSSWKPPLVLPTEPTWGIAVGGSRNNAYLGQWRLNEPMQVLMGTGPNDPRADKRVFDRASLTDFIPLTDEQVARIEAAR